MFLLTILFPTSWGWGAGGGGFVLRNPAICSVLQIDRLNKPLIVIFPFLTQFGGLIIRSYLQGQ